MAEGLDELQEQVKDIANAMNILADEATERFSSKLKGAAKNAGDLGNHFSAILKSSADLRKQFKTVADLEKGISSNAKLYKKIRSDILATFESEKKAYWDVVEEKIKKQVDGIEDTSEALKLRNKLTNEYTTAIEDAEEALKGQLDALEPQSGLWDVLKGGAIAAGAAIGKMLKELPEAMKNAFNAKSVEGAADAISKPFEDLLDSIPWVGGALKAGFQIIRKGFFSVWDYIEERVLPTNVKLTKQFGEMTPGVKQLGSAAVSMGDQFERMGKGLGEGARKNIVDFGAALQTTDFGATQKDVKELTNLGIRLTDVVGLSAEEAGKLAIQFDRTGLSSGELKGAMEDASLAAEDFGVPVNQVRKDMGTYPNILQRFGAANSLEFSKAAAVARSYGTNISDVTSAFGQQMDSFDGTAESAAKLNAVFGTNINSFELMLETDPTKRMTMLGKAVLDTGESWKTMDVFQKNVIKSTLGIDDAMGALVFSQKNVGKTTAQLNKAIEDQEKKQARQLKAQQRWDKSIRGLRTQLLNFEESIDRIVRALSSTITQFLGWGKAAKNVQGTANQLREIFDGVATSIESWNRSGGPEKLFRSLKRHFDNFINSPAGSLLAAFFGIDTSAEGQMHARAADSIIGQISKQKDLMSDLASEIEERQEGVAGHKKGSLARKSLQDTVNAKIAEKEAARVRIQELELELKKRDAANEKRLKGDDVLKTANGSIQLNPKDSFLATTAPLGTLLPKLNEIIEVAGQSKAGVNAPMEMSIAKLTKAIEDLKRDRSNEVKVEVVDINMDSRKVGEATVRMSRN